MKRCYTNLEWKFGIAFERVRHWELGFRPLHKLAARREKMLADWTLIRIMLPLVIVTQQMQLERHVCDHRHKADCHDHKNASAGRKTHLYPLNPQDIRPSIKHNSGRDLRVGPADGG
jgi:hypothetical protein